MKKFYLLFVGLALQANLWAQEHPFHIELGLNYPITLRTMGMKESHIGMYVEGKYRFNESPLRVNLKLSYESYSIVQKQYANSPFNGRSLVVLPSLHYCFPLSQKMLFYAGAGAGVTFDNQGRGVFNEGKRTHFLCAPQAGIELFKHLGVTAQYSITQKDFNRLVLGIGYIF